MKTSDKTFIMNTILLEVAIAENLRTDDLKVYQGSSGAYYIVSKEKGVDGKPVKVYFKYFKKTTF